MKFNKLAALLLASGFATATMAAGQGTGVINFEGEIIDAPCTLLDESATQTIQMGQVSNKEVTKGKLAATKHPINIKLSNCTIDTLKTVAVTFDGANDLVDTELLAISGAAKGAGILLTNFKNETVVLGTAQPFTNLVTGDNVLRFGAQLKGVDAATEVTPGSFTAISTFALEYK